ncbi:MAG: PIN domain nuclease [Spirochaetaceae bacterium]|jgi:predicted nucleic acid-binding protein|nr:PIN domain nuclease [Spirochaetaceae bacterium]
MIVADTSVWIDYFRGVDACHTDLLDQALLNNRVVTGDVIIAELLQGFRNDRDHDQAQAIMESLEYYDFLGKEMALRAAQNFRLLRKKGITIRKTIDVFIASFCIKYRFPLLHNDRDFDAMEQHLGLMVVR